MDVPGNPHQLNKFPTMNHSDQLSGGKRLCQFMNEAIANWFSCAASCARLCLELGPKARRGLRQRLAAGDRRPTTGSGQPT